MSKTKIKDVYPSARAASRARRVVALIAGADPPAELLAALNAEGLRIEGFDVARDLLGQDAKRAPDVIVVWAQDVESELLGAVESLVGRFGEVPVVISCPAIKQRDVRAALSAGASGVVLERDVLGALGPCLNAAHAGQVCVPRRFTEQVEPPVLSAREKQILGLVVMGFMNGQIAEQLFLSESTVKSHLSSAFGKLGVRSRNEAVKLILDPQRGWGMGILALGSEPLEQSRATDG